MDKIEKLFRKISKEDRLRIEEIIERLVDGKVDNLDMKKVESTSYYRIRYGRYRIIFKYKEERIVIETVRLKNDGTYKNLK